MKINQLVYVFSLLAGLLLLPEASRAQVKIGNNYTTIGSNSNLEVEATNGNKVIVDKTTGAVSVSGTFSGDPLQVTGVKEGQTSAAQTLMITADGYVQKAPAAVSLQPRFIASMKQNASQVVPSATTNTPIDFVSVDFQSYPGSVDLVNNRIVVPRAGYYQINGTLGVDDAAGTLVSTCIYYQKNATPIGENCYRNLAPNLGSLTGTRQSGSFSIVVYLNANDTVSAFIANSSMNTALTAGVALNATGGSLQVIELR
ncbi:hypothetical protein [Rudanella lutea]|uniref:hypothetical protein n=1 Tax=Rudanella lutea TaxID=451374 RepID=UPI0003818F64|nr:hypothetical protein [Rudanella lutea]